MGRAVVPILRFRVWRYTLSGSVELCGCAVMGVFSFLSSCRALRDLSGHPNFLTCVRRLAISLRKLINADISCKCDSIRSYGVEERLLESFRYLHAGIFDTEDT